MKRLIHQKLSEWRQQPTHKPIILRGARQVGKTHLVSQFAHELDHFVSINFEKQPEAIEIFEGNLTPSRLLRDLHLLTGKKVTPGNTLLFLDETQEAPRAITALRYFYEECPELHVIAAGSLLDFAIEKIGVPVGRVNFLYLYPMSFIEFLLATDRDTAAKAILENPFPQPFSDIIHKKFLEYVAEYIAIGGMPEVIKTWRDTRDIDQCNAIQTSIIESYRQDFEKYCKKHQIKYASLLLEQIPQNIGQQFKYSHVSKEYRKRELAPCLDLLTKALVAKPIYHSSAQGIPLGTQTNFDAFKVLFIDIALAQKVLGLAAKDWLLHPEKTLTLKGNIVESFVGQELLAYANPDQDARLYYWRNHHRGRSSEIDYLINLENKVIPIEVKSGRGTSLKSMRIFLDSHLQSPFGIRISTHNYSAFDHIHSYPLYAVAALMAQ